MPSLDDLHELNRVRIIDALRIRGIASRSELAEATGLSRTTTTTILSELQAGGLVEERTERSTSQPTRGRGRPPALVALNVSAGVVLGIDFGHRHLRVAVADLSSTVLAETAVEVDVDHAAIAALDTAAQLAESVLAQAGIDRTRLIGAGMGLPGPIDSRTGTVGASVVLPGWVGLNAGEELARRLNVHVEVDNDANLGVLAECTFGAGRALSDVVYVKVSSGIGSGLLLGGRVHRGASGIAGELGHVLVDPDGVVCRCGNRGCLETVASAPPLIALLRPTHGEHLTLRDMLDLVAAGDPGATRLVIDAGRAIGRALADLCNHLNPSAIVVGGELSAAGTPLLVGIRESIDRYAQPGAARVIDVRPGVLGDRAEVLGALALVIGDTERLRSKGLAALRHDRRPAVG